VENKESPENGTSKAQAPPQRGSAPEGEPGFGLTP